MEGPENIRALLKAKKRREAVFLCLTYLPQALHTLRSPFSQSSFTPVLPHEGQVPLQPGALMFFPLLALATNNPPIAELST